ncbi:MAG: hypothetical protein ACKV19_21415 [Verrucomicrobiales bacterium]
MATKSLKSDYEKPKTVFVLHDGRRYPLTQNHGLWRMRSQAKGRKVDVTLGTSDLNSAKRYAKEWLESPVGKQAAQDGRGTLEALAQAYLAMPKRVASKSAAINVSRLRSVIRAVLGKELAEVKCSEVTPDLWSRYFEVSLKKFDRKLDYTTRRAENIRLNAAVRAARCLFLPKLAPGYAAKGLAINANAANCMMLPEPWLPVSEAEDAKLLQAWPLLKQSNPRLWLAVGLARFAGLRREEIMQIRGKWIESKEAATYVVLRDRPEDGFQTKTGKPYRSLVLDPDLAAHLRGCPAEEQILQDVTVKWFLGEVCGWLRPFAGAARKPLHRLRGLYADQLARDTESAIIARQAGLKAAQEGLGHTSSRTTEKHYLDAVR